VLIGERGREEGEEGRKEKKKEERSVKWNE
jgi:hypothetical protein